MVDTSGHLLHKYEKKNLYTKTKLHINKTGIRCEEINTELTIFQLCITVSNNDSGVIEYTHNSPVNAVSISAVPRFWSIKSHEIFGSIKKHEVSTREGRVHQKSSKTGKKCIFCVLGGF